MGAYLPDGTEEIVSGGAKGVDASAREYAQAHGVRLTEFLPAYRRYGRGAPLRKNIDIIEHADTALGSRGTKFVIDGCEKRGVPVRVIRL